MLHEFSSSLVDPGLTIIIYLHFSFHNKLKTVYFNGKGNRRLDKLIHVLLSMERDSYAIHMRKTHSMVINTKEVAEKSYHKKGLNISVDNVKVRILSMLIEMNIIIKNC